VRVSIKQLTNKLGFISAVSLAAVVGGISTGVVMASVPDANGNIQTCYNNTGGSLRVIDTANESCGAGETALNLSQTVASGISAYFKLNGTTVDTGSLRNIVDYEAVPNVPGFWCVETAFDPVFANGTMDGGFLPMLVESYSASDSENLHQHCPANFNVLISGSEYTNSTIAWFTK
jgi:hypothetical protein